VAVLDGNDLTAIKDLKEVTVEEVIDRKGVMRRKMRTGKRQNQPIAKHTPCRRNSLIGM
jgi:hypothetical protein